MQKLAMMTIAGMTCCLTLASVAADQFATKEEAVAMVGRAVDHLQSAGPERAFAAFNDKSGAFVDRDLYIVVYDQAGHCVSHGANPKMIGKDLIDAQDIDGKPYVRERVDLAKANASFWQDYKFANPVSKKIEPKQMYCRTAASYIVCGGIYVK